ncbi:MAG TPA: tryptophan 2,3-dioxygenase family protein [Puia sp.]|uniref:tryptophan 2,3-dioxygenase n=1 Tax=Puia sp. TaxID=2045100 RepID=UPI002CDD61B7|nr:tryptophan 2,3-dioxygenase family protein [Puia sp.]HVU99025.1 tryptophan 2,3-dioxygenase family protein [Puia sp.]
MSNVHYSDYLHLDTLLNAQYLESDRLGMHAHDEMLFIVIHQAYELWFRQLLYEVDSVISIFGRPALNDNSPELQTIVHRLSRCATILKVLVHQIDIMETMTPMDFQDFRDLLRPASGFQSVQFKLLEARLGLRYENRFGQGYYLSQLRPEEADRIKAAEESPSLLQLLNAWLERMPFFDPPAADTFWTDYRRRYAASLAEGEKGNLNGFDEVFSGNEGNRSLSSAACRSALFIMLYRGYPLLQLPFQVLHQLLEIDEQLSTWRYRHMSMVHRTIGSRIGTGGSTGKDYLASALERHHLFREIAALTSFVLQRKRLPELPPEMERRLGFAPGNTGA